MSTINKILVIGAGIAGSTVCYWLKKFGFFPVLIERSSKIRKGGQGQDVRGIAIDIVKRMGIYEKICNRRTQVELGRYVDAEGNILHEEKGERFAFRQGEDVEINRSDRDRGHDRGQVCVIALKNWLLTIEKQMELKLNLK